MRNEGMRKQLNGRGIFGCWQLVASIWQLVALKSTTAANYLAAG
jgi:hypothetical protein